MHTGFGRVLEDRLQFVDPARKALSFGLQAVRVQQASQATHIVSRCIGAAYPREARIRNHVYVVLEGAFEAVRMTTLHRPQRLVDIEPLCHTPSAASIDLSFTLRSASNSASMLARPAINACSTRTSRAISLMLPTPLAPTSTPSRSSAKNIRDAALASRVTEVTPNAGMPAIWIVMSY